MKNARSRKDTPRRADPRARSAAKPAGAAVVHAVVAARWRSRREGLWRRDRVVARRIGCGGEGVRCAFLVGPRRRFRPGMRRSVRSAWRIPARWRCRRLVRAKSRATDHSSAARPRPAAERPPPARHHRRRDHLGERVQRSGGVPSRGTAGVLSSAIGDPPPPSSSPRRTATSRRSSATRPTAESDAAPPLRDFRRVPRNAEGRASGVVDGAFEGAWRRIAGVARRRLQRGQVRESVWEKTFLALAQLR